MVAHCICNLFHREDFILQQTGIIQIRSFVFGKGALHFGKKRVRAVRFRDGSNTVLPGAVVKIPE